MYRDILYIDTISRRKVCDLIAAEISSVMSSIGKDYYEQYDFKRIVKEFTENCWNHEEDGGYSIAIKHCFGYLPSHIDVLEDGKDIMVATKRDENEVKICSNLVFSGTVIIS